jgi:GNAT superfamily N-acetyltransferase
MASTLTVRSLTAPEIEDRIAALSDILIDCVEGGASVSFMKPVGRQKADAFWRGIEDRVAAGAADLLLALLDGDPVGTAQLNMALPENHPHRADVAKVLVHRRARNRGIGQALMAAVEERARAAGKTLLVLDTLTGGAGERLYTRMNWVRVGRVPGYAPHDLLQVARSVVARRLRLRLEPQMPGGNSFTPRGERT